MKMSDVFQTPIGPGSLADDLERAECSGKAGELYKAASHAINMHDKLVSMVDRMSLQANLIDDIVDEFIDQRSLPKVKEEQQKMVDLMNEAESLLTQAKRRITMTQQLTIEQLEFARSIGATHYDFDEYMFRRCGGCYESSKWWPEMKSHEYASYSCIQPIDFSPLEYTPKVGEECLGCWSSDPEVYYKVKILCTDGDSIIFRWLEGEHKGCLGDDEQDIFAGCIGFKPLPTEEEAGREKTIKHMVSLNAAHQWTPQEFAEALYDAGYRLQEGG